MFISVNPWLNLTRHSEFLVQLEDPATYQRSGGAVQLNRELVDVQDRLAELNRLREEAAAIENLGETDPEKPG